MKGGIDRLSQGPPPTPASPRKARSGSRRERVMRPGIPTRVTQRRGGGVGTPVGTVGTRHSLERPTWAPHRWTPGCTTGYKMTTTNCLDRSNAVHALQRRAPSLVRSGLSSQKRFGRRRLFGGRDPASVEKWPPLDSSRRTTRQSGPPSLTIQ